MTVLYKKIAGYPGYRVGADGSVWSQHKRGVNPSGKFSDTWKLRSPTVHKCRGYLYVNLLRADGKYVRNFIHVLVLEAFVCPRPDGMQVRHFPDSDVANNRITNLRWGTAKENADDRERNGNTKKGSENKNSKLTEEAVLEIRAAANPIDIAGMARKFNVSRQTIWLIRTRRTWTHI